MATSTAPASERTYRRDIEEGIGIDPIEVLQADRREVVKELAPLRAKYGPGGVWDAKRKAHRSAIGLELAHRVEQGAAEPLTWVNPKGETVVIDLPRQP